jgi:protein tyrosine phosphatase
MTTIHHQPSSPSTTSVVTEQKNKPASSRKRSLAQEMKKKFSAFFANSFSSLDSTSTDDIIGSISEKDHHEKEENAAPPLKIGEPVTDLKLHISKLSKTLDKSYQALTPASPELRDGFDLEFDALTKHDFQLKRTSGMFKTAAKCVNSVRNRYKNVLPNETTRVKISPKRVLGDEGEEETDYINANHIYGTPFGLESLHYIASQAPMQNTVDDFWQMCFEQNVGSIIVLADEIHCESPMSTTTTTTKEDSRFCADDDDEEPPTPMTTPAFAKKPTFDDKYESMLSANKIHRYWPAPGQTIVFGQCHVSNLTVDEKISHVDQDLYCQKLRISKHHGKEMESRFLMLYQYTGWPDMGVPKSPKPILKLMDILDQQHEYPRPILVHCSAGVGRTGTFCAIHITMLQMKHHVKHKSVQPFKFNVFNTVKQLKSQRAGMVQKREQYVFCYHTILAEAQALGLQQ